MLPSTKSIVVLDTRPEVLREWREFAELRGFSVHLCCSVEDAVTALEDDASALVAAYRLERGDSLEAVDAARNRTPPIQVVGALTHNVMRRSA